MMCKRLVTRLVILMILTLGASRILVSRFAEMAVESFNFEAACAWIRFGAPVDIRVNLPSPEMPAMAFLDMTPGPWPKERLTPLMVAVLVEDEAMVKQLLALGANPNARRFQGKTLLMDAIAGTDEKIVRDLLAAGADPAMRDSSGRDAAKYLEGWNTGSIGLDRQCRHRLNLLRHSVKERPHVGRRSASD